MRSREALDAAIAYIKADAMVAVSTSPQRVRSIKAGEGRAVAILAHLRDAGGTIGQREFEEICLNNCRTLVGAGGFIARGSIAREFNSDGNVVYKLTDKGRETVIRWEARYGRDWISSLTNSNILGDSSIGDQQKVFLR